MSVGLLWGAVRALRERAALAGALKGQPPIDGRSYRADVSWVEPGEAVDLAGCRFEERHVRAGAPVCVIGPFSEARGGIVPHPNLFKPVRLLAGDAARVASDLAASAVRRLVIGLLAGAAAAGVVAASLSR